MEPHEHVDQFDLSKSQQKEDRSGRIVWNVAIAMSVLLAGYLSYAFMTTSPSSVATTNAEVKLQKVIQLDVLNGCGVKGAAARVTSRLRAGGFDVVEMKNYKMNNVRHTIVVDRIGDLSSAHSVANALGVSEKNVVQQINPDYFVDVSVIIGEDFSSLNLSNY